MPRVVPEARLEQTDEGLVAKSDGWFVLNARDARWYHVEGRSAICDFEGDAEFQQLGINVQVLGPGEAMGMYHRENGQESFLVLDGECTLIVEGETRSLATWDFFYCAPGTEHIIVTTTEQRAVVLAVGARGRGVGGGIVYRVSEAAACYGASVDRETTSFAEAYAEAHAGLPRSRWVPYQDGWLPS